MKISPFLVLAGVAPSLFGSQNGLNAVRSAGRDAAVTWTLPAAASRAIRVYVAGESIERRNRFVEAPFTGSGALNERGGGGARNDNEEYGWMVPLRDRLRLRAPDLDLEFVGSDVWANDNDSPYTGTITGGGATRIVAFSASASGSVVLTVSVTSGAGCRATGTKTIAVTAATGPELLLPVILDAFGGNGTHYTTGLTLVSRGSSAVTVSLLYTAASGGGSGSTSLPLAPGEIRVVGDAIAFLRSQGLAIPADATSKIGSLRATFVGALSASHVFLGGRTSTPGGGGTFGLFYPALALEETATAPVWVYGLRQDATMRRRHLRRQLHRHEIPVRFGS